MFSKAILAAAVMAGVAKAQVTATGTMGTTNPPQVRPDGFIGMKLYWDLVQATMGTAINQTSYARLLSLNSIEDLWVVLLV
jgi:hypothetical protein